MPKQAAPAVVQGTVPASSGQTRHAKVQKQTGSGWKTIGTAEVQPDGTFVLNLPRTKDRHTIRVRAGARRRNLEDDDGAALSAAT